MKKINIPNDDNRFISSMFSIRLREVVSLLLVFFTIYLVMALKSFSANDSAWTFLNGKAPENSGGLVGAWLADMLFTGFGNMAWLFVFFPGRRAGSFIE